MSEENNFENTLENLHYYIATANNRVFNNHLDNKQIAQELENTKRELENIKKQLQITKRESQNNSSQQEIQSLEVEIDNEEFAGVTTNEIYGLKEETKSIVTHLDEMLKQIEKINEINAHMLELIEMKDAVNGKKGKEE